MNNEQQYWANKAALLDPSVYTYITGGFDLIVPEGHTWFVVNAWEVKSPTGRWFHRKLGIDDAVSLPAGTRIKSVNTSSFIYYADTFNIIQTDSRYSVDPKSLYYDRLARLNNLPLFEITGTRPAGTSGSVVTGVYFPSDFDNGLISHVSVMDLSWVILAGGTYPGTSVMRASNCVDEINDVHLNRFTAKIFQPFKNGRFPGNEGCQWNGIWCGHGVEGDIFTQPQTRDGTGTLHYYKLPIDW